MTSPQIYLNVSRNLIEHVVNQQYEKGYLLIQSADLQGNKVLLTFEKPTYVMMKCSDKQIKAVKLDSSDEIPDSVLEEVFKK